MAIAFSHKGNATGASVTSVTATVTVNVGDTVVVSVTCNDTATKTVSSVVDLTPGGNTYTQQTSKSNGTHAQQFTWASTVGVANAATSVKVTMSASCVHLDLEVATYTGVQQLGSTNTATGSSTGPSVALTTQDNNNFVVMGVVAQGTGTFSANVGNLRDSVVSAGTATTASGDAINDNTAATPSSVTNTVTISTSETWAVSCLELRSVAPPAATSFPTNRTLMGVGF